MGDASTGAGMQHLSANGAAALIAARQITSEEVVTACLEQIERLEPSVEAWEFLDPERALAAARERDSEPSRGPLHGVPFALKDVIDTAAMPTACGTPIYAGRQPGIDAACARSLLDAGGVLLGKTVTTELATWHPTKTRNPYDPAHTPGGSSSGSAAAVAARTVPLALGTQTVGSTIRPASFCGVIGMKPTLDAVDLSGVRRTSRLLDTIGLFVRTPGDLRLLLSVLGVSAAEDAARPLRVGLAETAWWSQADEHSRAAVGRAAALLREAGAEVAERPLPSRLDDLDQVHDVVATVDIAAHCSREYDEHADLLSPRMRTEIERGRGIAAERYEDAIAAAAECGRAFARHCEGLDVVLAPAVTGEAPRALDWTGDPIFNRPWSMLGVPAATVPVGRGEHGLPIGAQLIAPKGGEGAVLEAVTLLFAALDAGDVPLPPSS